MISQIIQGYASILIGGFDLSKEARSVQSFFHALESYLSNLTIFQSDA
jgi:hypothetical protein